MAHHRRPFDAVEVPPGHERTPNRSEERAAPAHADFPNVDARRWLQIVARAEEIARAAATGGEVDSAQAFTLAREIVALDEGDAPITVPMRRRDDRLRSE